MDHETSREKSVYPNKQIDLSPDPNTNTLISKILDRDKEGMDKFGLTMRQKMLNNPKDILYWLRNSLEEKIDDTRYSIEAIRAVQILLEENKKLKQQLKEEKEYGKMMYRSP